MLSGATIRIFMLLVLLTGVSSSEPTLLSFREGFVLVGGAGVLGLFRSIVAR